MTKHIKIKVGAGPNRNNNPEDILQIKQALNALDYYDVPSYGITPYPDTDIFSSIQNFQRDNDLTVDGIINPKGETEKAIDQQIETVWKRSSQKPCTKCGAWHAGTYGDVCKDCYEKGLGGTAPSLF